MQYILKETQKQTEAIGQVYTINTFDLGACMKVLPVQWFKPDELKKTHNTNWTISHNNEQNGLAPKT